MALIQYTWIERKESLKSIRNNKTTQKRNCKSASQTKSQFYQIRFYEFAYRFADAKMQYNLLHMNKLDVKKKGKYQFRIKILFLDEFPLKRWCYFVVLFLMVDGGFFFIYSQSINCR